MTKGHMRVVCCELLAYGVATALLAALLVAIHP
jgi:hypothetical protein